MAIRRLRTRRKIDKSTSASHEPAPHSRPENDEDSIQTPSSRINGQCDYDTSHPQDRPGAANLEQIVFTSALSMLRARSQSEAQLRRRLAAKFGDAPEIDRCIKRLKDRGYIDDSRLAENYAAHRTAVKAMGKARLGRELSAKLLSKDVIDSALNRVFESISQDELIDRAIVKRIRSTGVPVSTADRKKMFDHLARLGFEYDLIMKKLRSLGSPGDPG